MGLINSHPQETVFGVPTFILVALTGIPFWLSDCLRRLAFTFRKQVCPPYSSRHSLSASELPSDTTVFDFTTASWGRLCYFPSREEAAEAQ